MTAWGSWEEENNERAPSSVPCRLGYVRNLLVQWCSANAGRWAAKSGLGGERSMAETLLPDRRRTILIIG